MFVCGRNVVRELLRNNTKIYKVFTYNSFNDSELIEMLKNNNVPIKYIEKYKLDKMLDNNQGLIADIDDYKYCTLDEIMTDNPFFVMLDHITDPHNFGAIIRTCEAAGVDAIIIPKDRSVEINATVMKTSVGTLDNMKICMVNNLNDTIKKLKKNGVWIVGTDMEGTNYHDIDAKLPLCLIIGNEGDGISRLVSSNCDYMASIPMKGQVNSLNASVAAGIIIFEISTKRGL